MTDEMRNPDRWEDLALRRYRGGETQKVLAAEYGCAQSLISTIVSGNRGASVKKETSYVAG